MMSTEGLNSMVAIALQNAGVRMDAVKPLPSAHREFRYENNGGPSEKHGMSLFAYFEMKKPSGKRRIILVSA